MATKQNPAKWTQGNKMTGNMWSHNSSTSVLVQGLEEKQRGKDQKSKYYAVNVQARLKQWHPLTSVHCSNYRLLKVCRDIWVIWGKDIFKNFAAPALLVPREIRVWKKGAWNLCREAVFSQGEAEQALILPLTPAWHWAEYSSFPGASGSHLLEVNDKFPPLYKTFDKFYVSYYFWISQKPGNTEILNSPWNLSSNETSWPHLKHVFFR